MITDFQATSVSSAAKSTVHCQPSIDSEDVASDNEAPRKTVPKKASRILELADGSEDEDDRDDAPEFKLPVIEIDLEDTDNESNGSEDNKNEAPTESAEAELSRCPLSIKKC